MKITLEPADLQEPEVIIRGNVSGHEVTAIVQLLAGKSTNKLLLYKEEEQFLVDVKEIVYLEASGGKIRVRTTAGTYEARHKLYELKGLLSAHPFAQISKSTIVNIDHVRSIQAEFSGNYRIRLKNERETLTISRKFFKEFKEHI